MVISDETHIVWIDDLVVKRLQLIVHKRSEHRQAARTYSFRYFLQCGSDRNHHMRLSVLAIDSYVFHNLQYFFQEWTRNR